jgi:hypothetical protein
MYQTTETKKLIITEITTEKEATGKALNAEANTSRNTQ